jgi:hypothetical protein
MGDGADDVRELLEEGFLGLEPDDGHWRTNDGRVLKISDMSDQHLRNTVRMLRRKGFTAGLTGRSSNNMKLRELVDEQMIRDIRKGKW